MPSENAETCRQNSDLPSSLLDSLLLAQEILLNLVHPPFNIKITFINIKNNTKMIVSREMKKAQMHNTPNHCSHPRKKRWSRWRYTSAESGHHHLERNSKMTMRKNTLTTNSMNSIFQINISIPNCRIMNSISIRIPARLRQIEHGSRRARGARRIPS